MVFGTKSKNDHFWHRNANGISGQDGGVDGSWAHILSKAQQNHN